MKPTEISLGALMALIPFASTLFHGQDPQDPRPTPLQRVAPNTGGDRDLAQVFSRDFDRDRWRELLATPDLDQREEHFEALVRRAGLDPLARAFLEDLARDPKG